MPPTCKALTYPAPGALRGRPCSRLAVRDGFCKQHHPGTREARRNAAADRWEAEQARRERRHRLREAVTRAREELLLTATAYYAELPAPVQRALEAYHKAGARAAEG